MVPRLQNLWDASVGEELACKRDSGIEKDLYAVRVMQRSTIVGQATQEGISCLLPFLADQRQKLSVSA